MNNHEQAFSIKDLENICGIKAHTIRIWEKRYQLLQPNRTDTNIRTYDMESLQKLLNVSFLVNCGYKISRISKLTDQEVHEYIRSIVSDKTTVERCLNSLKLAMFNFNTNLFLEVLEELKHRFNFIDIFYEVFLPLLEEIGMLWQAKTINSTHEHFVTNIIKQKLWVEIDILRNNLSNTNKTFICYLPEGDINELSILFLNVLILNKGYKTIYLGTNVPFDSVKQIAELQNNLVFISYFNLFPNFEDINDYITTFKDEICLPNSHELWVMGRQLEEVNVPVSALVKVIYSFKDFEKILN